jgi:hypothetical protein
MAREIDMEGYEFWDEDVERVQSQALMGNADLYEIIFKEPVGAMNIHKDDVIQLAKCFGLAVYEKDSAL